MMRRRQKKRSLDLSVMPSASKSFRLRLAPSWLVAEGTLSSFTSLTISTVFGFGCFPGGTHHALSQCWAVRLFRQTAPLHVELLYEPVA